MTDEIDLILLNLATPVVDAVCATACGCWSEAVDYWFDVVRDPRFGRLASACRQGVESVVERCFVWVYRNRRRAKHVEVMIKSAAVFLYVDAVMLMIRRLACSQ